MQQRFNEWIKHDVKPLLAGYGFSKKGLCFSKSSGDLIYLIQFQKSRGNSKERIRFYVNCGIYAAELARLQTREVLEAPQEVDCHFRERMEELASFAPDHFELEGDSNQDDLLATLLAGLKEVIQFYDTIPNARKIVDYYTAGPYLHLGEESLRLLLQAKDIEAAKRYVSALRDKHGAESRWRIFEEKYKAIFTQYQVPFA
ncbi:DUF4304 domain-containing protein [Paenibacillus sp. HB172176]|uniref:DUF4304 domain-containing protein n=1 Tax=Paenibacillus sp. HB172176 TaxID=2493690 RepID=UPI001F10A950|nr:DUF4304 domain-containing protein [Paenibacillus sp. HB172176]